jgi:site-specific DNA recombinase
MNAISQPLVAAPQLVEAQIVPTARAFSYLRVSSDGQVKTDYSADGLSIDSQRVGAADKAGQLAAEIVREFADPGHSAYVDLHKRTSFLEMLDELKRCNQKKSTRVDYVIVWDLSRFCRNVADHFATHKIIREAGARLVSITEPLVGEDSASAFLYEGMVATIYQFQSMQTAEKVAGGLKRKASVGGTYGWARIGYLNTSEVRPDGGRIATINTDPDRRDFVTVAFQLYDSGEYSISQLATELKRLGLRTRPSPKRVSKPLGTTALNRLLRDRYYTGVVVYKRGTPEEQVFPGRHEPLIDVETFERVQLMLDQKRVAGERAYKHQHYLKGSVFCGDCGNRLVYSITTGRSKKYPYFFCSARINGTPCNMRFNIAPKKIEAAISEHYETVKLTPAEVEQAKAAIQALADVTSGALNHIRTTKSQLISKLKKRQDELLEMRFEKTISKTVFARKQATLEDEIEAAKDSLAKTDDQLQIDAAQLDRALELAGDVAAVYEAADHQTRRGYNQAFFKKLLVIAEAEPGEEKPIVRIAESELTEPYALLLAEGLMDDLETEIQLIRQTESSPNRNRASNADPVSNFERMAEREGFEPSMGL